MPRPSGTTGDGATVTTDDDQVGPALTGVWFVGARGSVATTAMVGALGVRHGLAPTTGLVTELPELDPAGLPDLAGLVFGGHDVSSRSLAKKAETLVAGDVLPGVLVDAVRAELEEIDDDVVPASQPGDESAADAVERLAGDIAAFREQHGLSRVVVIEVASTQPPVGDPERLRSIDDDLPVGAVYALAAFRAGLAVRHLHAQPLPATARRRRGGRAQRAALRRLRRQDRRDAAQVGARADVRGARTRAALVDVGEPARRRRRRHARRPGDRPEQDRRPSAAGSTR